MTVGKRKRAREAEGVAQVSSLWMMMWTLDHDGILIAQVWRITKQSQITARLARAANMVWEGSHMLVRTYTRKRSRGPERTIRPPSALEAYEVDSTTNIRSLHMSRHFAITNIQRARYAPSRSHISSVKSGLWSASKAKLHASL